MDIDVRELLPDVCEHAEVEIDAELRVMPSLQEDLHAPVVAQFLEFLVELPKGEDVAVLVAFSPVKRAKLAVDVADVGVVDVSVDDVGDDLVATPAVGRAFGQFAPGVGEFPQFLQGGMVKRSCLGERDALPGENLVGDGFV